jgi:hypothetical protein
MDNVLAQILQMVFSNPQMLQQLMGSMQMQGASQDQGGNPLSAIMQGAMPPQGGPSPMDQMTQGGAPGAGGPPMAAAAPAAPPPPAHKGGSKPPPHKGK